ncbi:hypothetical protein EVAR_29182_1 [Eumeta japonica]|uniref:Uncharacterized protein n=1 Tax=Eumeta variegata TaxID=151549 RepID=A0A4C1VCM5_EUMVA|nr:hypothetical protein EVAR_29182_1 [Eumeta japonica]
MPGECIAEESYTVSPRAAPGRHLSGSLLADFGLRNPPRRAGRPSSLYDGNVTSGGQATVLFFLDANIEGILTSRPHDTDPRLLTIVAVNKMTKSVISGLTYLGTERVV